MPAPLVAIVGAPNVGKSTLFNRLIGRRRAIVGDQPGVTRDRIYAAVDDVPTPFRVVDTGGLLPDGGAPYAEEIERQVRAAIAEADCLVFVVDAVSGLTAVDRDVATILRRSGRPVILAANKVDTPKAEPLVHALHELGLGDPVGVSAEHGLGVDDLVDRIEEILAGRPVATAAEDTLPEIRLALVGRPNVGKSSILNRLAGQERAVVSEVPGTTRDTVDTLVVAGPRRYRVIDTAGMRPRFRTGPAVERVAVDHAARSIVRCDVAFLVLDGTAPISTHDAHIAGLVLDARRPLVVAVNKWDLVEEREDAVRRIEVEIHDRLAFARGVPIVFLSARTGQRVSRLLELAAALYESAGREIPTAELNRWLREVCGPDVEVAGRGSLRVFYATQIGTRPPRFLVFCNEPRRASAPFRRHLESALRERFGLEHVPVRLAFRGRRDSSGAA
jgi:GTP-binding protein